MPQRKRKHAIPQTTLSVSEFKARALEIVGLVATERNRYLITKHGKVVAQLLPVGAAEECAVAGKLRNTVLEEGDLVSPLGAKIWSVSK